MCGCGCGNTGINNCANLNYAQITAALFLIAPQFSTVNSTILQGFVNLIACQVNQCILGCNSALAYAFLMAHYLTIATQPNGPNVGVYSDMKEGELSLGFNVDPNMSSLNTTAYGRAYLDLVKRTVVGSTVSNLPVVFGGVVNGVPLGCCGQGYGYGAWGY